MSPTDAGSMPPRLNRVVAVVATLSSGRVQLGTGYLLSPGVVITARHCTRDKILDQEARSLEVFRATGGATAQVEVVQCSALGALDVVVLRLTAPPWQEEIMPVPGFTRVDRGGAGQLTDCAAIGFPLFQYDGASDDRRTAELHGVIYQTDEAITGRLLLREQLLAGVPAFYGVPHAPNQNEAVQQRPITIWGGLSGAVVFHNGRVLGVVVEHHPRQGPAALQLVAIDKICEAAHQDADDTTVMSLLGLPRPEALPWASEEPIAPLFELVSVLGTAGELPPLAGLDPYRLGSAPSDYGNSSTHGQNDPYVLRTHADVDVRMAEGLKPGRLVLLVGPSKAGKTRTAFHAAWTVDNQFWPNDAVVVAVPVVGQLTALAGHPRWQTSTDPILLWLDDLQTHLTGSDSLTTSVLTHLLSRPGPTLLLATLRNEERDRLSTDAGELAKPIRAILDLAKPTTIELRPTIDHPSEHTAATLAYPQADLGTAGLAEILAHAPALLARYRDSRTADPLRYLVVRLVIDWARTGPDRPLPEPDLLQLLRNTLWNEYPDLEPNEGELAAAIAWARAPLPGQARAALLITHPLPGHIRGYRPFDYLIAADNGQDGRLRSIPDQFWEQILSISDSRDAMQVSAAAYFLNLNTVAITASRQAAAAGNTTAAYNLGVLLADRLDPPDLPGARAAWEQAAATGNTTAAYNLGVLLATRLDPPDLPGARAAFEQAAAAGHTNAAYNLGLLLADLIDPPDLPGARAAFEQAAPAGHTAAAFALGVLLAAQLDPPDLPSAPAAYE